MTLMSYQKAEMYPYIITLVPDSIFCSPEGQHITMKSFVGLFPPYQENHEVDNKMSSVTLAGQSTYYIRYVHHSTFVMAHNICSKQQVLI